MNQIKPKKLKPKDPNLINEYDPRWKEAIKSFDPTPEQLEEYNNMTNQSYEFAIHIIQAAKLQAERDLSNALCLIEYQYKDYARAINKYPDMLEGNKRERTLAEVRKYLVDAFEHLLKGSEGEDMVHRYGYFANADGKLPIDQFAFISDEKRWAIDLISQMRYILALRDQELAELLVEIGNNLISSPSKLELLMKRQNTLIEKRQKLLEQLRSDLTSDAFQELHAEIYPLNVEINNLQAEIDQMIEEDALRKQKQFMQDYNKLYLNKA